MTMPTRPAGDDEVIPPLRRRDVPAWLADWVADHPTYVRLYVPVMVTVTLLVEVLFPCRCALGR